MKKIMALLVAFFLLLSSGGASFALNSTSSSKDLVIIKPKEQVTATTNSSIAISGKGNPKDIIVMETYQKEEKTYSKFVGKVEMEIGMTGTFAKEIKLNEGEYKLVFTVKETDLSVSRIIKVSKVEGNKEVMKESMEGIKDKGLKEIVDSVVSPNTGGTPQKTK